MRETGTLSPAVAEVQSAIAARKQGTSWRKLADTLGVPYGTLYFIHTGQLNHVSAAAFRQVRAALGLPVRTGKAAHRPYITDPAKWAAYQRWSQEYDAEQEPHP